MFVLALTLLALPASSHGQTQATVTTLYSFPDVGASGGYSNARLVLGKDGNFYGTAPNSGSNGIGSIFRLTPAGALTVLHSFSKLDSNFHNTDGAFPEGAVVQGKDGNFYGTTLNGGTNDRGTVFKITPAGAFTTLHNFTGTGTDGSGPEAALIQGSDGSFYGTTGQGGSALSAGMAFKITPGGVFTPLYAFTGPDGEGPEATLVQGTDGYFYGTTAGGGTAGAGTVFQITPAGVLTTLYSFTNRIDGDSPEVALVQAGDGSFYGTTEGSSEVGHYGTVFKVTPAGVYTLLHHFTGNDTDGAAPVGGLIKGSDGNLYGTALYGGSNDFGAVFRMTPAGVLTTIYSFTGMGTDGAYPQSALLQGSDGSFYGTTEYGGTSDAGTVFKLTPPPPVITSSKTATATEGKAFSYQITATNGPASYGVGGLFKGITVNAKTGLISGTPTAAGN